MEIPKKRLRPCTLSFLDDEEEPAKLTKYRSNPQILKEKLDEESKLLQELNRSYLLQQSKDSQELLQLSFTYWDGTNTKYSLTVTKGSTILAFLKQAKKVLQKDYPKIEKSGNLMLVKENRIIPHDYRFQDLIICDAKGDKGQLFQLKQEEEDKWIDTGYISKVLERRWFEKNKHIFPASKWSIFEPDS